jgi:hypothetical protein
VLAVVFLLHGGSTRRRALDLAALLLPAMLIVGAHAAWRHSYYSAWLPNTFAAKLGVPKLVLAEKGIRYVLIAAAAYAPLLIGVFVAAQRSGRSAGRSPAILLACAAWFVVYDIVVGGDHFALFRFLVPVLALCALPIGDIAASLASHGRRAPRGIALAAVLLVAGNAFTLASPAGRAGRSEVRQAAAWAKTGRWCAAELPAGSIASMVVGAIPYYCDRYTLDLLGLTDRHIATEGKIYLPAPAGHQKYDTDYVLERRPRYIFFLSAGMPYRPLFGSVGERNRWLDEKGFALRDLATDPRALETYEYRSVRLDDGTWIEFLERR